MFTMNGPVDLTIFNKTRNSELQRETTAAPRQLYKRPYVSLSLSLLALGNSPEPAVVAVAQAQQVLPYLEVCQKPFVSRCRLGNLESVLCLQGFLNLSVLLLQSKFQGALGLN